MTVKELIKSDIAKLPIEPLSDFISFRKTLFDLFDKFMLEIKTLDMSDTSFAIPSAEKERVANIVVGIRDSIDFYLKGQPFLAYDVLDKAFVAYSIFSYLKNGLYEIGHYFYRLRENDSNFPVTKGEMFHIPFHLRSKVTTQRYSIPGLPCLYIADSIYVAWEEFRRPSLNKIQAIMLRNNTLIHYLNLTTDIYSEDSSIVDAKPTDELWEHLVTWSLIAACSVKVRNKDTSFKPEHIIPQLLLQIVRKEGILDGIRFSSTHINRNKVETSGSLCNLVLPVKDNSDSGYCSVLEGMFDITEPLPWEVVGVFSRLHGTFLSSDSSIPSSVNFIKLLEGKKIAYQYSTFGNLEVALRGMTLGPIN
jgi:hypothetical protein